MKKPFSINLWCIRLAIAGCFIGHGTIAIKNSNVFFSEWSLWVQTLFPESEKYIFSQMMLNIVGVIDLYVGFSVLLPTVPLPALIWALVWGFLTATSRLHFLSMWGPPYMYYLVRPVYEFLSRVPNWMCPLILVLSQIDRFQFSQRVHLFLQAVHKIDIKKMLWFAAIAQAMSLWLHFLVERTHEMFPLEHEKVGMPMWYFYLQGVTALIALIGIFVMNRRVVPTWFGVGAALFVNIAYWLCEGFEVLILNTPHGFFFTGIRLIEHMPIYLCLAYFLMAEIKKERSISSR